MKWNSLVPELIVSDYDKSIEFYTNLLGFSVRYTRDDPAFAYIELGEAQIMIEAVASDSWCTGEFQYPFGRGINLQIETYDIQTLYDRIISADKKVFSPLKENAYKSENEVFIQKEFLIQDPDGYLLRFFESAG